MPDDVSTPTLQYETMSEKWGKIRTLMGGTSAMREASTEFLPMHYAETKERYKERLQYAVLKNYFMSTVEHMAGKVFSKPVLIDPITDELEGILDNVDRMGSDITSFAGNVFQNSVAMGLSYVLVDYPETPQGINLETERNLGGRPYWVQVAPENVIGVRLSEDNTIIEEARIREVTAEYTGRWAQERIERIRILWPGAFQLWRKVVLNNSKVEWILEKEGSMSIDEVPLVPFYTKKLRPHFALPPLEDLADLNIAHWQSYSDQRAILAVTRFPILGASGYNVEEDPEIKIGPYRLLATSDPQGSFYYIEHSGTAIEAGRKDLEDLKEEMAMFGMQVFLPQIAGGDVTATQSQISNTNTSSRLQHMARGCESSLNECMRLTQKWRNASDEPIITLRGNFEMPRETTQEVQALITMRQSGEISRPTFFSECKRRGFLADDFDAEAEAETLANEGPSLFGGM